ncbi:MULTISPECIES: transcription initiation factor IIB [Halococcus]|uniref:Transcription initiation factor IIB n=1 Tax=Halococcus salifodinae DSM 8989 TaxID=1227456 RepID=M0N949_9EURY|nr:MULTISPECIES: TFIIB-type zinc ribbon-containing protein [Halococcus]EMA53624.1 transcription initiation factor TFB 2 [Halococcus salifodinae DSM 8989]
MVEITQTERESVESETTETEQATETCPECDGRLTHDSEHGERACSECGLVVDEDEIDHGPEWRAHTQKERNEKSRVGAPTTNLMHDKGLSTKISWQDKDAYGNTLSSQKRQQMQRLRTWDERFRTRNPKERSLKQALSEIERMSSALGLPKSVRETAGVIYRRALEENLLPGRSVEGVSTAALHIASRQANIPRSLDTLTEVSRIGKLPITRTYQYVARELEINLPPADPLEYLPRFVSALDRSDEVERRSRELLETVSEDEPSYLSGKNPVGLAAAAVYAGSLLCNEKVTQKAVGEVADISEVTIRNRYKELLEFQDDVPTP